MAKGYQDSCKLSKPFTKNIFSRLQESPPTARPDAAAGSETGIER
jgi:hypothetical protein